MNRRDVVLGSTLAAVLGGGCAIAPTAPDVHQVPKHMVVLDSPEGQALLPTEASVDLAPLTDHWVAQLRSHCGAASAVVAQNALLPDRHFTQDGLFDDTTAHIITQDVVYRIGFTLEELVEMIRVSSGLDAAWFRAGSAPEHTTHADFVAALRANRRNTGDQIICNFSIESLRGEGMRKGHFSPIAEYNEATDMVLVLEINADREIFWVRSRDLYDAMVATDPVCDLNRGWIIVGH